MFRAILGKIYRFRGLFILAGIVGVFGAGVSFVEANTERWDSRVSCTVQTVITTATAKEVSSTAYGRCVFAPFETRVLARTVGVENIPKPEAVYSCPAKLTAHFGGEPLASEVREDCQLSS